MRLDIFLYEKGYYKSRSRASDAISRGLVSVDGKTANKPAFDVNDDAVIDIIRECGYVSRAGEKLAHALDSFGISPEGMTALDIGASTGGFTDCLLKRGAKRVIALDVGNGQLDASLRNDSRVTVIENFNARFAKKSDFAFDIDIITMDVSFISQSLIYPACGDILGGGSKMVTLIKPQFEAGKQNIGKGGIVHDANGKIIASINERLDIEADKYGFLRRGFTESPILGGDGNREYMAYFIKTK